MSYCIQCGNAIENGAKFCSKCGAAVAASAAPAYTAAVEQPAAPVYTAAPEVNTLPVAPAIVEQPAAVATAPVVNAEPVVSTGTKVLGFVGMGLGIGGLFFAVLGLLYTLIGMEETGLGFGMSVAFGMLSVPLAIVGRILCGKSMDAGNTSSACSVGSKLGLAAIIVSAVMAFFGFINLMA